MQLLNEEMYYKGEIIDMSILRGITRLKKNQKSEEKVVDDVTAEKLSSEIKEIKSKIDEIQKNKNSLLYYYNSHPFKMSVFASLIASAIFSLCGILLNNYVFSPSQINSRLSSIESKLDDPQNNGTDSGSTIEDRISRLEVNVATIANLTGVNLYSDLEYTQDFIDQLSSETVVMNYYADKPPCEENDIIAKDKDKEYTKEQLVNEKLLISYTYNGQEVLFYGQYNEKNNWDKDCVINVYENDRLVLINETKYQNGVPLSFRQVYPGKNKEEVDVWTITDRKYENQHNNGENWNYFKFRDYLKTFDFENPEIDDIMYVSDFERNMQSYSVLEGYYCGEIQNGLYNDQNETKSYMMKNDKNGFVRTIYIGSFQDGDFNDHSGKAEEIVFDESMNQYFRYTGSFTNGDRDNKDSDALKYITQDEIDKIIAPYNFNCELNWHET